jgi:hypothetical protein
VMSSSQGLYLHTGQHKHRISAYTHQTPVPCVGFEPMIPATERAKTLRALERSATVTGDLNISQKRMRQSTIKIPGNIADIRNNIYGRHVIQLHQSARKIHTASDIRTIADVTHVISKLSTEKKSVDVREQIELS